MVVREVSEGLNQRFSETQEMDQVPDPSSGKLERPITLTMMYREKQVPPKHVL